MNEKTEVEVMETEVPQEAESVNYENVAPAVSEQPQDPPGAKPKEGLTALEKAFSGGLYLAMCIVFSSWVVLSSVDGIPAVLDVLIAVGMWLTYAFAHKEGKLARKAAHLDFIRIPLLINQIVLIVGAVSVAVTGIVSMITALISTTYINALYALIKELLNQLANEFVPEYAPYVEPIIELFFGVTGFGAILSLIISVLSSLVLLLFACLFNGAALSALKNFKNMLKGQKAKLGAFKVVRGWMIVYGIFNVLTADIFTAAVMIMAFVFAGKLIDALKEEAIH